MGKFFQDTPFSIAKVASQHDFEKLINLFEMYKIESPASIPSKDGDFTLRYLVNQCINLNQKIKLPLEHQVRFASLLLSDTFHPTLFFAEILVNKEQSFSDTTQMDP